MGGLNAGVDDIGAGSGTSGVVVAVCGRAGTSVGEASKAVGSAGLADNCGDGCHGVLLDVLDLFDLSVSLKFLELFLS